MDISTMDQGLLRRNPSLTPEEFYHHWLHKHAPIVVPFFLHSGAQHYEQIHGPLIPSNTASTPSVDISTYDGAAGMPPQSILDNPAPMPKWKQDYYQEVILADERRFLVSEALDHIYRVPPGTVKGERKVVIDQGKCLIEVSDEIWKVWKEYEARGVAEKEGGK
ncbi:uncharacterized protein LY89DRAFT_441218 [Mollisia scopiformis]|uniref:EthD domain-containing protein n=1 Tax=Mollisia scopiformis TaxID=149040 RepID=A0A194XKM1_MOLSC|nr:uncharacterized protein LY89DRAFT_441218 [Mollisia scopiformis]KUJ20337.1 hypothetical protein LY89DRAFT_441218 [Mollisia scopiformis]